MGPCTQLSLDYWVGPPHACPWGGSSHAPLTPGGRPRPPLHPNSIPFITTLYYIIYQYLLQFISNSSFMGEGPLDPPSLRGGPAGNDLVCLVGVSGMSCSVARVPRTPHGPVGGWAVNTCLHCSVVSVMPSGLWRGSPNPQPRSGPTVSNFVALGYIGPSCSPSSGPPARCITDTLGGRTPPSSSSHVHIISRLWPLPFSPLRGLCQSVTFPHSTMWAPPPFFMTHNSPTHSRGGRGAGHALPHPPHPPPSCPQSGIWGGGTHQSGSPLFLSWWRGSFGPPPPRLGAGSKHLGSAVH